MCLTVCVIVGVVVIVVAVVVVGCRDSIGVGSVDSWFVRKPIAVLLRVFGRWSTGEDGKQESLVRDSQ